jgi:hypothetical protein
LVGTKGAIHQEKFLKNSISKAHRLNEVVKGNIGELTHKAKTLKRNRMGD